jgi:hypothetical protein
MSSDKVGPSGLTEAESEEIHRNLIQGTQIFCWPISIHPGLSKETP